MKKWSKELNMQLKLICFVIVLSQLLLFCSESHAEIKSVNVKIDTNIYGHYYEPKYNVGTLKWKQRHNVGIEIIFKQFDKFPQKPEFGVGIKYESPYKFLGGDTFSFVPVYGLMSFKIHSFKDIIDSKLIINLGYNWFKGLDCSDRYNTYNYNGGPYYGIGIDHIIRNKILFGIHFSESIGYNEHISLNNHHGYGKYTYYTRYKRITFVIGYMFM